ncbi:MAG: molecular chaperone TorD family protein [Bacteroidetes bacterium]|nr:molecular chaperone TorD family protein [Bacteroidota bacterium]
MTDLQDVLRGKFELYRLLSFGFYYPSIKFYNDLKEKSYYTSIQESIEKIQIKTENSDDLYKILTLDGISFEEYESQFILDFETNMPRPSCSLHERHYLKTTNHAQTLLELKAFYKNFELSKSDDFDSMEDHIILELEFMYFITFKELQAIQNRLDDQPYKKCKKDFLERHLKNWIPEIVSKAKKNVKSKFHRSLLEITLELVENDFSESLKFNTN